MGRKSTDPPPEPAPLEAILRYKSTLEAEDGPSLKPFKVDFSEKSPEHSAWNRRLSEMFVDDYVKKGLPFSEVKKVPEFLMTYLRTLQDASRKTKATPEQAQAHKRSGQRTRIAKRKKTVSPSAHRNVSTVTSLINLQAVRHPSQRLALLWNRSVHQAFGWHDT